MNKLDEKYKRYLKREAKKQKQEQIKHWVSLAKKEAERISNDIDFVIEKIKSKEYGLDMAKEELLWRVLDMESHYVNCDISEVNEVYQEVLDKARAALKRVEEKIQEEGLDK